MEVAGVDDEADFQSMCAALDMLGVGPRCQVEMFTVLAAILHLGNIEVHSNSQDKGVTKVRGETRVCLTVNFNQNYI